MTFLRPELRDVAIKWKEPLALGALAVVAIVFAWRLNGSFGFQFLALLLAAGLGIFTYVGIRRVLLRDAGLGRGLVEVTEREIRFFADNEGGVVALSDLISVDLSTDLRKGKAASHYWILSSNLQPPIIVPGNALGIEDLLGTLSALPGIKMDAAMRFNTSGSPGIKNIWKKPSGDVLPPQRPLV
ncbi:MAG: hypothetical protein AAF826_01795 [Pseudomonadota bacterium]